MIGSCRDDGRLDRWTNAAGRTRVAGLCTGTGHCTTPDGDHMTNFYSRLRNRSPDRPCMNRKDAKNAKVRIRMNLFRMVLCVTFFKVDPGGRQGHVLNFLPFLIQIPPQGLPPAESPATGVPPAAFVCPSNITAFLQNAFFQVSHCNLHCSPFYPSSLFRTAESRNTTGGYRCQSVWQAICVFNADRNLRIQQPNRMLFRRGMAVKSMKSSTKPAYVIWV